MKKASIFLAAACGLAVGAAVTLAVSAEESSKPVYIVAQIEIHDREEYRKYEAGFGEIFVRHGGQSVAFSEAPVILEGTWDFTRTVVVRFESHQAAMGWYESPEYQELVKHRWAASKANIILIDGR